MRLRSMNYIRVTYEVNKVLETIWTFSILSGDCVRCDKYYENSTAA